MYATLNYIPVGIFICLAIAKATAVPIDQQPKVAQEKTSVLNGTLIYLGQVGLKKIYLENTKMSWFDGHDYCLNHSLQLIQMKSQEEYLFLEQHLTQSGDPDHWSAGSSEIGFRTNGTGELSVKGFSWTTMRRVGDHSFPVYEDCEIQAPIGSSLGYRRDRENCLALWNNSVRLAMNVHGCYEHMKILCQSVQ